MDYSCDSARVQYGHCSSYFHETDDVQYARRIVAREQARRVARDHQKLLAENLSLLTSDDYQEDILDHMEYMETITSPDVNAIDIQAEVQWYMRPYLLDFLVEAHAAFQLHPETLYLTINLLDRYCSKRVVYKKHYQLVGCASLLIAAKYGDRKDRVPTVRELTSMCCGLYDDEMFTQMEWHVLATLQWLVGHPTVDSFLQMALSEMAADPQLQHMAWYICEISLFHKEFVSIRPSIIARSALFLARGILSRPSLHTTEWSARCDHVVVENMWNRLEHPSQVLQKKYGCDQFSHVATTLELFIQRQAQLAPISVTAHRAEEAMSINYILPITPQKTHYPSISHGYVTPPITPDSDVNMLVGVHSKHSMLPRIASGSPSPASTEQQAYSSQQYSQYRPSDLRYLVP